MFARRTDWPLGPNALSLEITRRRECGLGVIDLTESNPTRCGFRYDSDAILRALAQPAALRYEPEPRGPLPGRNAVAAYYAERRASVDPGQIFLTSSTSEAYSNLFRLLADAGDAILVPQPSYPLFDFLAGLNDLEILPYALVYNGSWRIDLEQLAARAESAARQGRTVRALVVVHPNNPTGSGVSAAERAALAEICRRHGLALIADEVFSDYRFPGEAANAGAPATHAGVDEILTFTLSGLSKVCALPQMKLAWIVVGGPPGLRQAAIDRLEIIADTYLSVNTPVAAALPELLAARGAIQSQILGRLLRNRAELERQIQAARASARLLHAEGGWYAVRRLASEPDLMPDDDAFAGELARREGVVVHPGHFYGFPGEGWLVLSLLPLPDVFSAGIGKIWKDASS